MDALDLFPHTSSLCLNAWQRTGRGLRLDLTVIAAGANCPLCGQLSNRVHSRYRRTLADLPWSEMAVRLELQARKFFCGNARCRRRIFVEPLTPALAARYARRTLRLQEALHLIVLIVGGEAGARLSRELRLHASPDTLLRAVKRAAPIAGPTPRVLGVDDFALRRGRTYGTLLVDLERHNRVDLLPDRRAETFAAWLKQHPGVEIISRDRGEAYADGARQGAPDAVQVADRWHLLKNLGDALERLLIREHRAIREAALTMSTASPAMTSPARVKPLDAVDLPLSRKTMEQQQRRQRRLERYQQVNDAYRQGMPLCDIERTLGVSPKTVRRYLTTESFPERVPRPPGWTQLQPFHEILRARWDQGCHNSAQLWREIQSQGYCGGQTIVKDYVRTLRSPTAIAERRTRAPACSIPSARNAAWLLLRAEAELEPQQRQFAACLEQISPSVCAARNLALRFLCMVRERRAGELEPWIAAVENSGVPDLKKFARGLSKDKAAVVAALSLPWSNGQTEGQVNRLKLIKRQMYGRASFALLRARVLASV